MTLSVRHLHSFNQMLHFRDLKEGGNCAAYCLLVMSYISMFNVKYPKTAINYSRLNKALKNFPQSDKRTLNINQYKHYDIINLHEYKIKKVENLDNTVEFFKFLSIEILIDCTQFKSPLFYIITFVDEYKKIMGHVISHAVLLYISASHELHFFDSLSGLYILNLPKIISLDHLRDHLVNLIFKKNILMKIGCDLESKTLELNFWKSPYQQSVKHALEQGLIKIINNPETIPDIEGNAHEMLFLKINAFMLKIITIDSEAKPSFFPKVIKKKSADKHVDEIELTTMKHRRGPSS